MYLQKIILDSGLEGHFNRFRRHCKAEATNKDPLGILKQRFQRFMIGNTPINGITEVNRIFPKILNIMSARECLPGTVSGRLTTDVFQYTDLMYNRVNWRDVGKIKATTRQEHAEKNEIKNQQTLFNSYRMRKAVNFIKQKYSQSEVRDQWSTGRATHVHHIFPQNRHPQLRSFLENLIKLTAEQHLNRAHPNGKTSIIDTDYQCVCLLAKTVSIQKSLRKGEFHYSKPNFVHVINTGLKVDWQEALSWKRIQEHILTHYNDL